MPSLSTGWQTSVEYFYSGTQEFAEAIHKQAGSDPETVIALIEQYRDDNPGTWDGKHDSYTLRSRR